MRTNIVLDDELVAEGMRLTGARSKRELVHRALAELVERRRPQDWQDLVGKIRFYDGYDPKALRQSRYPESEGYDLEAIRALTQVGKPLEADVDRER
jgi:hypothetical protein